MDIALSIAVFVTNIFYGIYAFSIFSYPYIVIFLATFYITYINLIDNIFLIQNNKDKFLLHKKFYPSYRFYNNLILHLSFITFSISLIIISYEIMVHKSDHHILYNDTDKILSFLTDIIYCQVIIISLAIMTITLYKLYISLSRYINCYFYNKMNKYNYIDNNYDYIDNNYENNKCWICEQNLNKLDNSIIGCECKELYHTKCLNEYLVMHKNYCRFGHKVRKYIHDA